MNVKIKFINPNTEQEVDKYLPKILASAVINKINRELAEAVNGNQAKCCIRNNAR